MCPGQLITGASFAASGADNTAGTSPRTNPCHQHQRDRPTLHRAGARGQAGITELTQATQGLGSKQTENLPCINYLFLIQHGSVPLFESCLGFMDTTHSEGSAMTKTFKNPILFKLSRKSEACVSFISEEALILRNPNSPC